VADLDAVGALVTTCAHEGTPFVAAVERGPLSATQFHPEKSADAGAALLANWVSSVIRAGVAPRGGTDRAAAGTAT
jgi:glutamine amidotransferase